MSLLDEVRAARVQRQACTFVSVYAALTDEDGQELREALADPQIMGTAVAQVLKKRGFQIGQQTVQRHRRGMCACGDV